jgi:hypothetical protein
MLISECGRSTTIGNGYNANRKPTAASTKTLEAQLEIK